MPSVAESVRQCDSVQAHDGNDFTLTIPRPGQWAVGGPGA